MIIVWVKHKDNQSGTDAAGNYTQLATRFYTREGAIYLRPLRFYRTRR